ncbi:hypothetical protein [Bacillus pumilus]|uniref:Uncharacterized protein n=1 Tax=Bacillus pumilus TaxID=1408 RepID=A0AAD0HL93_BACPU|nr:hypothetical protein [Bacillus pumilus]AVM23315.1 hypothetical protein C5695_05525 [Bacillus pumilus]TYS44679.1 hypothetical protein FZC68_01665 [Bacillus pumilus]
MSYDLKNQNDLVNELERIGCLGFYSNIIMGLNYFPKKIDCLFCFGKVIEEMGDYKSHIKEPENVVFHYPIVDKDDRRARLDVSFMVAPVEDAPGCNEFIFQHLELHQGL